MYVITIQRTNWIRWELTMRTEHAVSSTSQIPVWPHITPTTSALVWTSYSLNIFSQPCLPRPVYPLQVFGVLQPAKKCNLWPKSVICEHPSSITHSISLIEWHNENLDNCVRDACVLNKIKFSRWGGLLSFICGHNLQISGQCPGNRSCECDTTCGHNKAIITIIMEICKLPTYQNMRQNWLLQGAGSIQLSFLTFWHWPPWLAVSSRLQTFFPCSWKMHSHSLMLMPAPQCVFLKLGLDMLSAIILATVGAEKSFLQSLQNTWRSPFEDGLKNGLLLPFHFYRCFFFNTTL